MDVLLSWSGKASREAAAVFRTWLPRVLPEIVPWHSTYDIDKGRRWFNEIRKVLKGAKACIIFFTPDNVGSPWIYWESGAIAAAKGDGSLEDEQGPRIIPFLIGLNPSEIKNTPVSHYQATQSTKGDISLLVEALNRELGCTFNSDELLGRIDRHWKELELELKRVEAMGLPEKIRILMDRIGKMRLRFEKEWSAASSSSDDSATKYFLHAVYLEFKETIEKLKLENPEKLYCAFLRDEIYRASSHSLAAKRTELGNDLPAAIDKLSGEIAAPYC